MGILIMGAAFGAACGIVGTSLVYQTKIVAKNRRIKQLEKQLARATAEPRF